MTIDEAINHCLERAEENDNCADKCEAVYGEDNGIIEACRECAAEYRQLADWLGELKEAKRLSKAAVEALNDGSCNKDCRQCENRKSCDYDNRFKWKHTNEVLKLIGGEADD